MSNESIPAVDNVDFIRYFWRQIHGYATFDHSTAAHLIRVGLWLGCDSQNRLHIFRHGPEFGDIIEGNETCRGVGWQKMQYG